MSNGFFARPVRYRLIACIGVVAGLISPAAAAQSAHPRATERIDRDLVRDTVESLATVVRREYMDAETAGRVDASLRKWLAEDRYAGAVAPEDLASMLTRDLFELTRDQHLSVAVLLDRVPGPAPATR